MGNNVASPPFTQYAAVWPTPVVAANKSPTAYTSLPETAIPTAEEEAVVMLMLLGMGNVVGVPFTQYAALPTPVAPFVPPPATYTSLPETVIPPAP
jgi:hypothetical protein